MSQVYIEFEFVVEPLQLGNEILIAQLGFAGFESFVETPTGVKAYIPQQDWEEELVESIQILQNPDFSISYSKKDIEQINWNQEWEKNFNSIEVDDTCVVRAPFHPASKAKYEIVIEPKMSFGTGHHETTYMMLQYILEEDFTNKRVLDMGCGTAVLAILTEMKGATAVDAIDIDAWCYENSKENCVRNGCKNIQVYQGDVSLLAQKKYDVIIANINRNILLRDIPQYCKSIASNGILFLSGFYKKDLPLLIETCKKQGLVFVANKEENKWVAAKFLVS